MLHNINKFEHMIGMLSHHFSDMTQEQFKQLPTTTNAVESHNRLSKSGHPEILRIAMLSTYKIDMAATLEHMAKNDGISTSYGDTNAEIKRKRKRKQEDEGPPDKRKHFKTSNDAHTM